MKAIVKLVAWLLTGCVLILAMAAAYVAATFDPNRYKPRLVQAVKDLTQRTLTLEGDIGLAFFPALGATLGKVSLSERGSDREFAAVDDIRVAVRLAPLWSKQVVIDAIEIRNLRARLVRLKDGTTNIDDLTGFGAGPASAAGEPPVIVDIDHVAFQNAAITYTDEAAGATYALSKLNLRTGRIAGGVPVRTDLSFTVQSEQPAMNLETVFKAAVGFDLDPQRFTLAGIDFGAQGRAAGIDNLVMTAKGDVAAKLASREFLISNLAIAATGKQQGGDLDVKLDAPKLTLTNGNVSGERLVLDAALRTLKGKYAGKFEIPAVDGNAKAFKAGAVTANIDMQHEGARIKASLTGPLAGSVEARKLDLPKLVATVNVNDPKLLKIPLAATLNASAQVDFARQNASFAFAAKFDDSSMNGKAALAKFTPPSYTFEINIDQLDADRYLPQSDPKQPFELAALKNLKASGSVQIGTLTMSNVKAKNVRIELKAAN